MFRVGGAFNYIWILLHTKAQTFLWIRWIDSCNTSHLLHVINTRHPQWCSIIRYIRWLFYRAYPPSNHCYSITKESRSTSHPINVYNPQPLRKFNIEWNNKQTTCWHGFFPYRCLAECNAGNRKQARWKKK